MAGNAGLYSGLGPRGYVDQLFAPQAGALQQQQDARTATLKALVGQILGTLPTPAQASGPAQAAIVDTNALARASAARLAAANPNQVTQADLAAINAPQAQRDQIAGQNQTVFEGGAGLLGYTGGVIPSDTFARDLNARNTYLASLPAIVGATATQGLGRLNLLASQETGHLAERKASALQQAVAQLADYATKKQSNRISQAAVLGNLLGYVPAGVLGNKAPVGTLAGTRAAIAQQNADTGVYNANTSRGRAKQAAADASARIRIAQQQYGLSVKRLQIAQQKADTARKTGGLTPYQLTEISTKAEKDAENFYYGIGAVTRADGSVSKAAVAPVMYKQAIRTLLARYPALGPQRVVKILDTLYAPGEGGRPAAGNTEDLWATIMSFGQKVANIGKGR